MAKGLFIKPTMNIICSWKNYRQNILAPKPRNVLQTFGVKESCIDPKSEVWSVASIKNHLESLSVCSPRKRPLTSPLCSVAIGTIIQNIQRSTSYILLYAGNVFLRSHNQIDLEKLVQKLNDRLLSNDLRLNLSVIEFLTTDSSETGTVTINGSDLPRTASEWDKGCRRRRCYYYYQKWISP